MSIDPAGFARLAEGFLSTRASANTRAAYARDLAVLADALGLGDDAVPDPREVGRTFGVEDDPAARAAAAALAALGPAWFDAWRDGLTGRPSTRRRRVAAVRALTAWSSQAFGVANPASAVKPPGVAAGRDKLRREVVALTPSASRRLCEAAARPGPRGARDGALVELLYGCGLRASEAVGLNVSDCRLDDPGDPHVVVMGKGAKPRAVAVPATAVRALDAYLRVGRPELRTAHRGGRDDADAVFLSHTGLRLRRQDVWRIVTAAARRGGLLDHGGRVFPHALRHSCGTHLIQSGIDIRYVQAHLGHASPVTTEVYTHVTAAHLRSDFDRAHPRSRAAREAPPAGGP